MCLVVDCGCESGVGVWVAEFCAEFHSKRGSVDRNTSADATCDS